MAKIMNLISLISVLSTAILVGLYGTTKSDMILTLAITAGTTSYHFVMRLFIGWTVNLLLKNHLDYKKRWFSVSAAEEKLYKKIKVKKWKGKMATYAPESFDIKIHSWDDIAQAMCQAEIVHELIIVMSFLPLFAARYFGALPVFAVTSVMSACYDAMFVVMQRYNRPRIMRLIKHSDRIAGK